MSDAVTLDGILDQVSGVSETARSSILAAYPALADMTHVGVSDLVGLDGVGKATARKVIHALEAAMGGPTDIDSFRHKDKRINIPTDQHAVKLVDTSGDGSPDVALYPRDRSLDPQLVWRGKAELDRDDLAVPVVPIYIQEKIDPRAIIENIRVTASRPEDEPELRLFDDFDGISDPIQQIEYYQHDANWSNRLILGDSLVAMTSLAEKEDLKGKVQMVYIDPPYGISFASNWQVTTRNPSVRDGKDHTRQPEQIKAFRDTWRDGVNTYLGYLRDRLRVAHGLLASTGSIFVQIGDDNIHLVRSLLDEVFGSVNLMGQITFKKTTSSTSDYLGGVTDWLLWYAKDRALVKYRQLYRPKEIGGEGADQYTRARLPDGTTRSLTAEERAGLVPLPKEARPFRVDNITGAKPPGDFPFTMDGQQYRPPPGRYWSTNEEGMNRLRIAGRLYPTKRRIWYLRFLDDFPASPINNLWDDTVRSGYSDEDSRIFVVQTSVKVVERCILMTTDPGDLVLDPTCGSGTTAYAAEKQGRRWITIDTSRVALALTRQRLMGAAYPYYLLVDSTEGAAAEAAQTGGPGPTQEASYQRDIRRGFVYERLLHVMPSTIAKNPDVVDGVSEEELDRAVRRYASYEHMYDRPLEDQAKLRVAGPITVESLSPHRTVSPGDLEFETQAEALAKSDAREAGFVQMVIDNLGKAGVQNGYRQERLELDWLDPYPGLRVQAVGAFTDLDREERKVAVSIGPETGTVGREHIAEAAKEAVKDVKADILLVCAYAFDAGAGEEAASLAPSGGGFAVAETERRLGKMRVLNVRINADLMMDDELRSTGAGNLFMVFGEPDINVTEVDEEMVRVELHGLDIYDPNTAEIRTAETNDIACWFIDTNYSGDAFFARHAYFTGGGSWDPYKSLKRALNAEIDPEAWDQLYGTESIPFPKPQTGRIAVKAINHFGDEAMKVFAIS